MKKIITLFLALTAMSANAQFLFRVSGNHLKEPSYIMGSTFTMASDVLDKMPAYLEAEAKCKQLFVEFDMTDTLKIQSLANNNKINIDDFTLPDGKNIMDLMNKNQIELLNKRFKDAYGVNFTDSAFKSAWNQTPSAIATLLETSVLVAEFVKHDILLSPLNTRLEYACISRAKERGLKVRPFADLANLNSIYEQVQNTIIDPNMSVDSLVTILNNFEQHKQEVASKIDILFLADKFWLDGDYNGYAEDDAAVKFANSSPAMTKERNEKVLPQMQAAMNELPTMFLFTAGLLIGDNNIIQELRSKGYKVEQINR